MADHLRFAACYWHNFCWNGADMFSAGSFDVPAGRGDALEMAKRKADVAFEFSGAKRAVLLLPRCRRLARRRVAEKRLHNFAVMTEVLAEKQQQTGVKTALGTANCFTHPRYGAGAATNPDPGGVCLGGHAGGDRHERHPPARRRKTMRCGAAAKVTRVAVEYRSAPGRRQIGRFLQMVVEHKRIRLALAARCLSSRNRRSPKHQYDYDVATAARLPEAVWSAENEIR